MISFWNFRLEKQGQLKCLKSCVSENLWTVNMLKGPQHCLNMRGSIFVNFFDHSEKKSAQRVRNTAYICTAVFWSYFLITQKENQLKKFSFSRICNIDTVC